MIIRRQWPFLVYLGTVPLYHATQIIDCECTLDLALERQPRPDPVQPEGWVSARADHLSRPPSIETSAPGTTVSPKTGEGLWIGHAPAISSTVLDEAAAALRSC
jgi:hypothetical protein